MNRSSSACRKHTQLPRNKRLSDMYGKSGKEDTTRAALEGRTDEAQQEEEVEPGAVADTAMKGEDGNDKAEAGPSAAGNVKLEAEAMSELDALPAAEAQVKVEAEAEAEPGRRRTRTATAKSRAHAAATAGKPPPPPIGKLKRDRTPEPAAQLKRKQVEVEAEEDAPAPGLPAESRDWARGALRDLATLDVPKLVAAVPWLDQSVKSASRHR